MRLWLWGAPHKQVTVANALYPDFVPWQIRGILRAPDVETKVIGGTEHVVARLGQGTSLFDRPGVFGAGNWTYFEVSAGTEIPVGLIITRDGLNEKYLDQPELHDAEDPLRRAPGCAGHQRRRPSGEGGKWLSSTS